MEFKKFLEDKLAEIPEFLDKEQNLIKNKVIESAQKLDDVLISKLLEEEKIKGKFFKKINDVFVFDSNLFIDFIQDKDFLDNSYTKYKNKIGLVSGNKFISSNNLVVLNFPFKDCVLEGGQDKEERKNRKEIFFNEVLATDEIDRLFEEKVLTNFKRIDKNGEKELDSFNIEWKE